MGMYLVLKALFLFTASFFVLFAALKTNSDKLKKFGRILAIVMWIIALYLVVTAVYSSLKGSGDKKHSLRYKHHGKCLRK